LSGEILVCGDGEMATEPPCVPPLVKGEVFIFVFYLIKGEVYIFVFYLIKGEVYIFVSYLCPLW